MKRRDLLSIYVNEKGFRGIFQQAIFEIKRCNDSLSNNHIEKIFQLLFWCHYVIVGQEINCNNWHTNPKMVIRIHHDPEVPQVQDLSRCRVLEQSPLHQGFPLFHVLKFRSMHTEANIDILLDIPTNCPCPSRSHHDPRFPWLQNMSYYYYMYIDVWGGHSMV